MHRFRSRGLTVAQQYHALRSSTVFSGGTGFISRNALSWKTEVAPSPVSRLYGLKISYKPPATPNVYVASPDLGDLSGGRKLPHVYEQRPVTLCLYLPGTNQWQPSLLLERTVLPWAVLWLFYFEEWLESDDWKGGGVHPGIDVNAKNSVN
jgi:hypothetical protein